MILFTVYLASFVLIAIASLFAWAVPIGVRDLRSSPSEEMRLSARIALSMLITAALICGGVGITILVALFTDTLTVVTQGG